MTGKKREFLFPPRAIPALRGRLAGCQWATLAPRWDTLVGRAASLPDLATESLAVCLTTIRLCDCVDCGDGRRRLYFSCEQCASRALRRSRQSPLAVYGQALAQVRAYLGTEEREKKEKAA